jgi:hypothetical protein
MSDYIPVAVEYIQYPGLPQSVTFVRTDVMQSEARRLNTTLCELAIEYCKKGGLETTGRAHIYEGNIFKSAGGTRVWKP